MPLYEFGCKDCGACRDVLVPYAEAQDLELVCTQCGGAQTLNPVLSVNVLLSHADTGDLASRSHEAAGPAQRQGKSCGHAHHCRCAVHLTKPNPFRKEIRKANGIVDEE